MKKVVKITAYVLCLVAVIALTVCYLVIPTQTKNVVDIIMGYMNTPVAVAGISTTIGGIVIFLVSKFVISNTKFGKKELEKIKDDVNNAKVSVYEYKSMITEEVEKYKVQFDELKQESESKASILYNEFEDLQHSLLESLKAIPNKKVQSIVEKYETEYPQRKEEIIDKVMDQDAYVEHKIQEVKENYEEKYQELYKELTEKMENLKAEAEVILNETEERIDNQATEE